MSGHSQGDFIIFTHASTHCLNSAVRSVKPAGWHNRFLQVQVEGSPLLVLGRIELQPCSGAGGVLILVNGAFWFGGRLQLSKFEQARCVIILHRSTHTSACSQLEEQ